MGTSFFLARKSFARSSRAVMILTPLVVALAVTNLLFFTGLFAGIMQAVDRLVVNNMFSNILVEPAKDKDYIPSADAKLNIIDNTPGVVAGAPHYKASAAFSFDRNKDGRDVVHGRYNVISIEPDREARVTTIHDYVIAGRYLRDDDREEILIGAEVAGGQLAMFPKISLGGVRVGDTVRAEYPNGVIRSYKVAGIYKSGADTIDMNVYVSSKEMENVLGVRDSAAEIIIKTTNPDTEDAVIAELRARGITDEKISSWKEFLNYTAMLKTSFNFLNMVTNVVGMLVVNITVFIIIFINAVNKRKQLGILRAVGIRDRTIIASYVFQTIFYCLIGVAASILATLLILVPYFNANPLNVGFGQFGLILGWKDILWASGIVFLTNLLAGFIPSIWAIKRQTIIQSIWGT